MNKDNTFHRKFANFAGNIRIHNCEGLDIMDDDVKIIHNHKAFVKLTVEKLGIRSIGTLPIQKYKGQVPGGEPIVASRHGMGKKDSYMGYYVHAPGRRQEVLFFGKPETLRQIQTSVNLYHDYLRNRRK